MPAAAQPEYELSIEITTGMSAPPIGMMSSTPTTNASAVKIQNHWPSGFWANNAMSAAMAMPMARFSQCWAGNITGSPDIVPDSLAKAMIEPEKVIAPMTMPSDISMRLAKRMAPVSSRMPKDSGLRNAAAATSTAAMPTRLWKPATSSGIAVIWMRRAMMVPMMPPTAMAARMPPYETMLGSS